MTNEQILRDAAQQALEFIDDYIGELHSRHTIEGTMRILKAALEQPANDADALTIAYSSGYERGKDAGRAATPQPQPAIDDDFKNFHRNLCARFDYCHDEKDWKRDQVSLIEHIAKKVNVGQPAIPAQPSKQGFCSHRICDARNNLVESGYTCVDCGSVFAAADHFEKPTAQHTDATPSIQPAQEQVEDMKDALRDLMHIGAALKGYGSPETILNRLESVRRFINLAAQQPAQRDSKDAGDAKRYQDAILDECAITHMPFYEPDLRKTLRDVIQWHVDAALDPKVSEVAAKWEAELSAMTAERDHWKANHDNMVTKCAFLSQRPDLPVDRIHAYGTLRSELWAMKAERDELKLECVGLNLDLVDLKAERDKLLKDRAELIREHERELTYGMKEHADTLLELNNVSEELGALKGERAEMELKVDALMLEFCPDEMTPEQLANYGRHQRRASPELEAQVNAALRPTEADGYRKALLEVKEICVEMELHYSAHKDTALLNGDVELSNAASGEPRAMRFLQERIDALLAAITAQGEKP